MADVTNDIEFVYVKELSEDELEPVTDKETLKLLGEAVTEHIDKILSQINALEKPEYSKEDVKKSYLDLVNYIKQEDK